LADICIALDAMGGDHGPRVIVPAALEAVRACAYLRLILVGQRAVIESYLKEHSGLNHPQITLKEASQVVDMGELPAVALRTKKDSSMRVAINLVKEGVAGACVSAGNTGALMATARFVLKMLPGVDRPAIVYSFPTMTGHAHVLDLGANVNCSAEDLFQFAVMGSVLATAVDNNPSPKVGLLNIGSEVIKGNETVKKASELLSNAPVALNYIGFVEGDDIYKGTADVVVCDGFVGNVALKTSEGLAKMLLRFAREAFTRNWYGKFIILLARPLLRNLQKRFDPARYNGASLLGVQGIVIKSHGNADHKAFAWAIKVAILEVEKNVLAQIKTEVVKQLGGANI
jgi:glycerol-3-phosphate acyltransferase PlsX